MCTGTSSGRTRPEQLGLSVVWDNPAFNPEERAEWEDLLARVLAESLAEACAARGPREAPAHQEAS